MKEPYKVTIGIALYNCEKYIERCLKSVINQTYSNLEIIIINDGSTDEGLNIIENIKEKNKETKIYIYNKENGGLPTARNMAIKKSSGKFIMLIDADDWLESDAVSNMVDIQLKTNSDIVKANYYINIDENKSIKKSTCNKYSNCLINVKENKEIIAEDIINGNIVSYTWSMLIRKKCITEEFMFEEEIGMLEDKIFLLKIISNIDSIYFFNSRTYHYFLNLNGIMHKSSYEHYLSREAKMNKKINNIILEYYNSNLNLCNTNNSMTTYGIERNLFNIYKTTNRDNMIKEYRKIEAFFENTLANSKLECLERSEYAVKRKKILEQYKTFNIEKIIKEYNYEIVLEKIKNTVKKIIRR